MLRRVIRRPAVNRDLIDCFVYIGEDNEESAMRFLRSAEETFRELARMPGMGTVTSFTLSGDLSLRRWRIRGFENFLIFYLPIENGIEVVRVLHGAREIARLWRQTAARTAVALGAAAVGTGWNFTLTSFETPGSCMVTP